MKETSSAGGIVVRDGKVVLVCQGGVSWSFPKGHVEKGETPLVAAKREIREECGLKNLQKIKEFGSYRRKGRKAGKSEMKTIHLFLFHTPEETLKPADRAITDARWVEMERVAEVLSNEKDREFFLSILEELKA